MNVLLRQIDGKLPNVALMRVAAHHRALGDTVEFRYGRTVTPQLWDAHDRVYASAIFKWSRPDCEELLRQRPDAILGGTGWDVASSLESHGITTDEQDYSLYPQFTGSIGFLRRGCRLSCWFCVVPRKEGKVRDVSSVARLWRGEPYPKHLHLLDNDFFGSEQWRQDIADIRAGGFKVSFTQGINARMLSDEAAAAIASVDYRDDGFKDKRIYTAWDDGKDEKVLFRGLSRLVAHGVRPRHIMVYMLIGAGEPPEEREYRRAKLREFGALPYPMPYERTRELVGFQRWVIGSYDKRVPWAAWERANYQPRQLGTLKADKEKA